MNFLITKKFILDKVEYDGKENFYTLLDIDTFQKFVSKGTPSNIENDIQESDIVEVDINIQTMPEKSVLKSSKLTFIVGVNSYISKVRKSMHVDTNNK